ncbi:MAG: LAGLIDADG family homing endonuclease, partial [Pseudonocardiaceae bacterium]
IEDIVDGQLPVHVVAADKAGMLHSRPVVSWFDQGEQDVMGLRLRDGTELWMTPDHKILTESGWCQAGQLAAGDRVARPREFLGFGDAEPVTPDHARLLGYLIGDGYVGGKTPVRFINFSRTLQDDAARIAGTLGCAAMPRPNDTEIAFSHRPGEKNGVLELCRQAGIWGKLAPEKQVPSLFFAPDISAEVLSNLLFGLFETDGYVSRDQTGGIRVGYSTTSEQLAQQVHWLLSRWGIGSTVSRRELRQQGGIIQGRRIEGKLPAWEVRVAGINNVKAFAGAVPIWGPRGQVLNRELTTLTDRYRGSQNIYLSSEVYEPVLAHLAGRGVTAQLAAQLIGDLAGDPQGGMRQVLGLHRLRRDRLARLADTLDDAFLYEVLAEQVSYAAVAEVLPSRRCRTFDIEVDELHNFVADDVVVHNCAPPF